MGIGAIADFVMARAISTLIMQIFDNLFNQSKNKYEQPIY